MPELVMVIEDEKEIRDLVRYNLERAGYRVNAVADGETGLRQLFETHPDALVLDLMRPGRNGLEILREIRGEPSTRELPVLVLSARSAEMDKLLGFEHGADDYLTKPFGTAELLARIRVALRHGNRIGTEPDQGVFQTGDLRVDRDRHDVSVRGQSVKLTALEYRLLDAMIRHAGRVVTQRQLLREVWGEAHVEEAHYLRVYMSALRRKLEENPARPKLLITEQSVGYRLRSD